MIKVRYNTDTGQVLKRYPADIEVPQPFVEITKIEADALHELPEEKAWFYENGEFVVKDNPVFMLEQKKKNIHSELTAVYKNASLLQQAKYEPVRNAVQKYLYAGELDKVEALLIEAKDSLEANVQPIAQSIYDKYIELTGG